MRRLSPLLLLLTLVSPAALQRKQGALPLLPARRIVCEELGLELKAPRVFRPLRTRLPQGIRAAYGATQRDLILVLRDTGAGALEDAREQTMKGLQRELPSARARIRRGRRYGGMPALILEITGIPSGQGRDYQVRCYLDAPGIGIVSVELWAPAREQEAVRRLAAWVLPTVRRTGLDGLDLLLGAEQFDYRTGLRYRLPLNAQGGPEGETVLFAGLAGKATLRLEAVPGEGEREALLARWLEAESVPRGHLWTVPTLGGGKAYVAWSSSAPRAAALFAPAPDHTFRILVSGGDRPELLAEDVARSLTWVDVARAETEVASWERDILAALKANDMAKLKRFGRRLVQRAYLRNARRLARLLAAKAPIPVRIFAVRTLGRAGDPKEDVEPLRRLLRDTKLKEETELRREACRALGNLVSVNSTKTLLSLLGDRDTKVARAAVVALAGHRANRKLVLPRLIREWERVQRDKTTRSETKRLRALRLEDALVDTVTRLAGERFQNPTAARRWLRAHRKALAEEPGLK